MVITYYYYYYIRIISTRRACISLSVSLGFFFTSIHRCERRRRRSPMRGDCGYGKMRKRRNKNNNCIFNVGRYVRRMKREGKSWRVLCARIYYYCHYNVGINTHTHTHTYMSVLIYIVHMVFLARSVPKMNNTNDNDNKKRVLSVYKSTLRVRCISHIILIIKKLSFNYIHHWLVHTMYILNARQDDYYHTRILIYWIFYILSRHKHTMYNMYNV